MGLKRSNYEVKNMGVTLPQAYAVIRKLNINDDYGTAELAVQANRELAFDKDPYETVNIFFKVNRNENPYKTAYAKAKEKTLSTIVDPKTQEETIVESKMPFADWEDDLIIE